MRPDWDADSPELRRNLARVLESAETQGRARAPLTLETARRWQREIMQDLAVGDPAYVGAFRGERDLEDCQVRIGAQWGVPAEEVASALLPFEQRLQEAVTLLDSLIPPDSLPNGDQTNAVIELCAWAHAEWFAFIHLPMLMAALRVCGSTASPCATACLRFCNCGPVQREATQRPAPRP